MLRYIQTILKKNKKTEIQFCLEINQVLPHSGQLQGKIAKILYMSTIVTSLS